VRDAGDILRRAIAHPLPIDPRWPQSDTARMRTTIVVVGILLALCCVSMPAFAEDALSGDEILAQVDAIAQKASDFQAKVVLSTVETNGKETTRKLQVWQKGGERRMVKITAPARLRGVGLLSLDGDKLWLYLPAFSKKVRRIAGRKRSDAFFGSNFTQDDISRTAYRPRYAAKVQKEDGENWTLALTPKKPGEELYKRVELVVRKSDRFVTEMHFYEDGDKPARTVVASDVREHDGMPMAHTVVAKDLATGSVSTATISSVKVNTGLKDDFFSKRRLQR
jgi:outer membrane lipoprotein-sorting protein